MLPLARAAGDEGTEVAIATAASLEDVAAPLPFLPAGPELAALGAEGRRRLSLSSDVLTLDPTAFAELFAAVRIDMTFPDALAAARRVQPDLIVADREDTVGPMVAGALGIPWARFLLGIDLPHEVSDAISARAVERYTAHGVAVSEPSALLDPWPQVLQPPGWRAPGHRIAVRPEPHRDERSAPQVRETRPDRRAAGAAARYRPRVLLTTGTVADDEQAVAAAVDSLLGVDAEVVLTGRRGAPWPLDVDPGRVHQVGFVPLAELLQDVDVAVVAGGSGTVTGALSRGVPLVVMPLVYDQHVNAERAEATGAAVVVSGADQVGVAVRRVLDDPAVAAAAADVAARIAAVDSPRQAWRRLLATLRSGDLDSSDPRP